jgi:hypothetical protein
MSKTFPRKLFLISSLILAMIAIALAGGTTRAADAQWFAQFWNNVNLSGDPVHTRLDNTINFDWGGGSPHSSINDGQFSARWTRSVNFSPAGTYRFSASMDDGMRVWLDGNLIIDSWTMSQEHTMTTDQFVSAGDHDLRVEYFEDRGQAVARFSWALVGADSGGAFYPNWKAEYFNNTSLAGPPVLVRDDRYLSNNWGTGSPAPGIINNDLFSARWTRTLNDAPGLFRIILTSDDGSRLFINNVLMIDNWAIQGPTSRAITYSYPGGPVEIRVEYFENAGNASIQVHLAELNQR